MNSAKTFLLLALMTGLVIAAGWLIAGPAGAVVALLAALVMNAYSYWNADKIVLKAHKAVRADSLAARYPQIRTLISDVEAMADRAMLPHPKIYVVQSNQPNAFATGRNPQNAAVAITTGMFGLLSREEIAAVMAHELAHVKNRDTLTMTVAATMAGAASMITSLAWFTGGGRAGAGKGIMVGLAAPLAATIIKLAVSRTREFSADRLGAEIVGRPLWLASALQKIDAAAKRGIDNHSAQRHPGHAHLFISNPLTGAKRNTWFSSHPSMENRITRLESLAVMMSKPGYRPDLV